MPVSRRRSRQCRKRRVGRAMRTSSRLSGRSSSGMDTSRSRQSSHNQLETWLPIQQHPGYEVSSLGRVRGIYARGGERIVLKQIPGRSGAEKYARVKIGKKRIPVHRLVCEIFHGPAPQGKPNVLHFDDDPTNNRAGNLSWGDVLDNAADRVRNGTQAHHDPGTLPFSKLTWETARAIRARVSAGERQCDLAVEYGVSRTTVCNVIKRKVWVE